MAEVILAHEKHGNSVYGSALGLLERRVQDGYWYDGEDAENAQAVLDSGSEKAAWVFLQSRSDYEYEYVERQEVTE